MYIDHVGGESIKFVWFLLCSSDASEIYFYITEVCKVEVKGGPQCVSVASSAVNKLIFIQDMNNWRTIQK
jgi:hypothetical protein